MMLCPFCMTSPLAGADGENVRLVESTCRCGRIIAMKEFDSFKMTIMGSGVIRDAMFQVRCSDGAFGPDVEYWANPDALSMGTGAEITRVPPALMSHYQLCVEVFFHRVIAKAVLES